MTRRLLILLWATVFIQNTDAQEVCEKSNDLIQTVQKFHYAPPEINENFTKTLIVKLFEKADPYGLILSREDHDYFTGRSDTLIHDLNHNQCVFYQQFQDTFAIRLETSQTYFRDILNSESFTLTQEDTLVYDEGRYYEQQSLIAQRWHQWMQYMIVNKIYNLDQEKPNIDSLFNVVKTREQCRVSTQEDEIERIGLDHIYLSSIAESFDPHTNYFSKDVKKEFFTALSDEKMSFGFNLERNDKGQLIIATVKPGSSAWKTNKINPGDILLEVLPDQEQGHDFHCIAMHEARKILNQESLTSARFVFEKVEGFIDTVLLHKAPLEVEDNIIQSFIIKSNGYKTGYIYLPSFYSGEEASEGCASDIARSILRLKRENIQGLVIDLRNNGGGYMEEAIKLSGMFINDGTLGIYDTKFEASRLIRDRDRGTLYSGPLAVMVNQFSASASEFFAITMQDYNRAVIVGEQTFGKSTAQNVFPIVAHRFESPEDLTTAPSDFVKVTISRFYRVNGHTYQKQGVAPDIVLPNLYSAIPLGERKYRNALEPAFIERETYFKEPLGLPLKNLIDFSNQRKESHLFYPMIQNAAREVAFRYQNTKIPIGIDTYRAYKDDYNKRIQPYTDYEDTDSLTVENLAYLSGFSDLYEHEKIFNASIIEDIQSDFYIKETVAIINNLIQLKQ